MRSVRLVLCGLGALLSCTAAGIPNTGRLSAGTEVSGNHGYIRYTIGNLPLIIGVPHGGTLEPAGMPDRISTTGSRYDTNSLELARAITEAFRVRTGRVPHLIINTVHRKKLDTNREVLEAAQDDTVATQAWEDFHGFIDRAKDSVRKEYGAGLYIDLHGHRHPQAYLELGYLLVNNELALPDDSLGLPPHLQQSSIRAIGESSAIPFPAIVRGTQSLGALYESHGYRSVPSLSIPSPKSGLYFSGGYSTERHGSRDGGTISAIQLETPWEGVRDTENHRRAFADASVDVLLRYLKVHFHYAGS